MEDLPVLLELERAGKLTLPERRHPRAVPADEAEQLWRALDAGPQGRSQDAVEHAAWCFPPQLGHFRRLAAEMGTDEATIRERSIEGCYHHNGELGPSAPLEPQISSKRFRRASAARCENIPDRTPTKRYPDGFGVGRPCSSRTSPAVIARYETKAMPAPSRGLIKIERFHEG